MKSIFNMTIEDVQRKYLEAQKIVLDTVQQMGYASKNNSHYDRSEIQLKAIDFIRAVNEGDFDSLPHYWFESDINLIAKQIKNILVKKFNYMDNPKIYNLANIVPSEIYTLIGEMEIEFSIKLDEESCIKCDTLYELAEVVIEASEGEKEKNLAEQNTVIVKALMTRYLNIIQSNEMIIVTHSKYLQKPHLIKLCTEAIEGNYQQYKIDRHLGYIQCALEAFKIKDLEQEIELCRWAFNTNLTLEERLQAVNTK